MLAGRLLARLPRCVGAVSCSRRALSLQTLQTQHVKQGGKLNLELLDLPYCRVDITSRWQDHCDLSYEDGDYSLRFHEDADLGSLTVTATGTGGPRRESAIEIFVPEYLDISIDGNELDLRMKSKIQGDMAVSCTSGSVVVDKLRGEVIALQCGEADLTVRKLIEGNSFLRCRSLSAKMINGDLVNIEATHVSVEAIYGADTTISASDDVTVGLSRGAIQAHSRQGNVSLSGVDGACLAVADRGTVRLQVNKLLGRCVAQANEGHIIATLDPEMEGSLECMSETMGLTRATSTVVSDAFELLPSELEPGEEIACPRPGVWEGGTIRGRLTGKSASVKRPTFQEAGRSGSGKINLEGAEAQQLDEPVSYPSSNSSGTDATSSTGTTSATGASAGDQGGEVQEFDISLSAYGNIRVETMSWIQVIRSKYGFEDKVGAQVPGRTASSGVKAAQIASNLRSGDA
ncbi:hypothetical protein B484DRAFT_417014 [Ochromonadaceae sp. CCMP2298]|nr:hypothetical protein B484DRAFT_417014 [Ochromonadaceae sp. CCMP2298]